MSSLTRGFPNHLLLYPSLTSFHKCKKSFGGAAYWEDPSLEVKLRLAKSNSQRFSPMMRALHHLRRRSTSSERRSGNRPALRPLTPPRRRHGTPAISRKPGQRGGGVGRRRRDGLRRPPVASSKAPTCAGSTLSSL